MKPNVTRTVNGLQLMPETYIGAECIYKNYVQCTVPLKPLLLVAPDLYS